MKLVRDDLRACLGSLAEKIVARKLLIATAAEGESVYAQRLGYFSHRMGAAKAATRLIRSMDRRSSS